MYASLSLLIELLAYFSYLFNTLKYLKKTNGHISESEIYPSFLSIKLFYI